MNLEFFKNLPTYQKLLALFLINILIVAMFFWFFYLPQHNIIAGLQADLAKLNSEIGIQRAKAEKLEQLKKENAELEKMLAEKKKQLPPEAEVASLLKQVSDLGLRVGLDFKLWKPSQKKEDPSGLYTEIPVDVEVGGGYHTIAMFFDSVSKLPRIVNISNIRMAKPKIEKGRLIVNTSFVATAFAATEPKPADDKKKAQAGVKGGPAQAKGKNARSQGVD